jgi:alcohol dehydrogenase class IV
MANPSKDAPSGRYNYPTAYRIGCGRRRELAEACGELRMQRPLVVTDPGVANLDWFGAAVERLRTEGLACEVFQGVQSDPVEQNVIDGVAAYRAGGHDGCVLIGGGSVLDAGKCVALMAAHPGSVFDYEDVGDNWKKVDPAKIPPMIAVPTTSGTGSEVGRAAVITDERDHSKRIIFHPKLLPPLVIADPELTFELPPDLTATTGMDALSHCLEALCAPGFHPMADGIALEGMRLIHDSLLTCCHLGDHAIARTNMMMASAMGATAFQKGLGLVHALAHPLGGATGVPHGLAIAILLPYGIIENGPAIEEVGVRLARHLSLPTPGLDGVLEWILELRQQLKIPRTLAGIPSMSEKLAAELAPKAAKDPSMATNPGHLTVADLERTLVNALRGNLER